MNTLEQKQAQAMLMDIYDYIGEKDEQYDVFISLYDQFAATGKLSPKQMFLLSKIHERIIHDV